MGWNAMALTGKTLSPFRWHLKAYLLSCDSCKTHQRRCATVLHKLMTRHARIGRSQSARILPYSLDANRCFLLEYLHAASQNKTLEVCWIVGSESKKNTRLVCARA